VYRAGTGWVKGLAALRHGTVTDHGMRLDGPRFRSYET